MLSKIRAILFINFISFGIHAYLAINHFKLKFAQSSEGSICNINQTFNCDAVASTQYSELFNIPLAIWGLVTHVVIIGLIVVIGIGANSKKETINKKILLALSLIVAITSVVMGAISLTKLSVYCIFCIALYGLSFINLYIVYKLTKGDESIKDFVALAKSALPWLIAIPALSFFVNRSFTDSYGGKGVEKMINASFIDWSNNPTKNITSEPSFSYGPARDKAKMVITEFADFRCVHCQKAAPVLHNFVKSRSDVRLEFYSFPLDGKCNPAEQMNNGPGLSCSLAKAAFCAAKENKGLEMNEHLFNKMTDLYKYTKEDLDKELLVIGSNMGINKESFNSCLESKDTQSSIMAQAQQGVDIGVEGTPSIYINNKYIPAGHFFKTLEKVWKSL